MELDLDYFRGRLEAERERLQAEIDGVYGENTENVDTDGQRAGVSNHPADAASDVMSRERNLAIAASMEADLAAVRHALQRIEDGTYGLDEETGEAIPVERLEARPSATRTVQNERARP